MKKILLTLLVALSLAWCGSVVFAEDGSNSTAFTENNKLALITFQNGIADDREMFNQRMMLFQNDDEGDDLDQQWLAWWGGWQWWIKIFCARYDRRCCEASPVRWVKWCWWKEHKADLFGCGCQ